MDIQKRRSDAYRNASGVRRAAAGTPGGRKSTDDRAVEGPAGSAEQKAAGAEPASNGSSDGRKAPLSGRGGGKPIVGRQGLVKSGADGDTYRGGSAAKVAKLLMLLGRDEAATVLSHLSDTEVEAVARYIASTEAVDGQSAREVLAEFGFRMETMPVLEGPAVGGRDVARSILSRAFGIEQAEAVLARALGERRRHFAFLNELEASQIRPLIRDESPAVLAVILGHLEPSRSAELLALLSQEARTSVIRRMAAMKKIDTAVLDRVEEALRTKVASLGSVDSQRVDGRSVLAEILRHMQVGGEQELLRGLQAEDRELAEDIEDRLFTIESLLLIEDRHLAAVLAGFSDSELALILKGKDEEIRRKVLENLSQRRREIVAEEYRFLGPVLRRDVAEATTKLLATLRQLEAEGRLLVRRDHEKYI